MRPVVHSLLAVTLTLSCHLVATGADRSGPQSAAEYPNLRKLAVPASQVESIATRLNLRYRDVPGIGIAPDVQNEQLLVMAPQSKHESIVADVQRLLNADAASPIATSAPLRVRLRNIRSDQFERYLHQLSGDSTVTTTGNDHVIAHRLNTPRLKGTTVSIDRQGNQVTVVGPANLVDPWKKWISSVDKSLGHGGDVIQVVRFDNAEPAPIQKTIRLLRQIRVPSSSPVPKNPPQQRDRRMFRNAVFQQDNTGRDVDPLGEVNPDPPGQPVNNDNDGPLGNPEIQIIPELGQVIIKGTKRDAQRIMDLIKQIEEQSKLTKPDIEVVELKHADGNAVATLLQQLYEDVLSARQGEVSITSLDAPNALLLIGRREAIAGLKELIEKVDQPISESARLRVFRLQHASAADAAESIREFFTDRPGSGDDVRPGLGSRVRVLADFRTNSLIVSAAPRDLQEVTRLVNELDISQIPAQSEIKVFPLNNAVAEDLAPVLQQAISGQGEDVAESEASTASTSVSIVALDSQSNTVLDSGVLNGAIVTADTGANSIVVRAPSASMPLIGELIRQLDQAPGFESLVKVFTIENGDALQLSSALQDLFGSEAATEGTSVGAANLAGLPPLTAGGDSSLIPLRFSTDQRTNSIIVSGAAEDLEVVESILLRLDSAGFAERITEVIWLRHQAAEDVALAIQSYVQQRTQTVNTIQQFQQGLGPFDLPDRDLIVVPEPVSNSVLLSVSPRLYADVRRMIDKLDRRPPMVMIQVLLAEVALDDTFEIGGELGLQDALLYDRGVAAAALPGAGEPSVPGFNFNGNGTPNLNSLNQGTVASRSVSSFGVGTTNPTLGYGGFVLSAASDSVSLLLRTLQQANRLQVLSRPQINTLDNTEARVQVGRTIARVTGVINNVSNTQVVTEDIPVGLILIVRPRVGSDGLIIMNIEVTRSDRDSSNGTVVPAGDGTTVFIDDILETTAESVIAAYNGQTVVFGGLIQKTRANFSRRVPFISDIPLLGYLFKYDQETELRNELLLVMTPMLISGQEDLDYIKEVESSRMSWCLADVVEAHGDVGLSGGYGLWGPAVGQTIYPDLQPTVSNVIMEDAVSIDDSVLIDESETLMGSPVMIQSPTIDDPNAAIITKPDLIESVEVESIQAPPAVPIPLRRKVEPFPEGLPAPSVRPIPNGTPNSLQTPLPDQQSRFEPIEQPIRVQQASFPTLEASTFNNRSAGWSASKWHSDRVSIAPSGPKPTRLGSQRAINPSPPTP